MPHPKLARLLGVEKPRRIASRVESTASAPSHPEPEPPVERAPPATGASGTGSIMPDSGQRTGWLFLFYDTYAARTGTGQRLVVNFVPQASLPPEATAWRRVHAVDGRIVVGKNLPSAVSSRLGTLIDFGEPFSPPRVVSCVVDATGRDAFDALQAVDSDSEAGAHKENGEEEDEDEDEDECGDNDDEENPEWDT
jgi:hypothetical protein